MRSASPSSPCLPPTSGGQPEHLINRIVCADCMDILRALPDKCVDLVLTDPPYGKGCEDGKICRAGGRFAKYGNEKFVAWDTPPQPEVFAEIFRVSKQQIIWGGNYFSLPPTRCFNVWRKLTISEKLSFAMCEYAWCSFDSNAKMWAFCPQDSNRFHPTQKPVALFARQIEEYTEPGALILDPFSGSGTTAIACHLLGRRFICIERDPDYHAASVERYRKHTEQGLLAL